MAGSLIISFDRYLLNAVCLIIDDYSSHINLDTSKFCEANDVLLYCLPLLKKKADSNKLGKE